jgi:phage-related protein
MKISSRQVPVHRGVPELVVAQLSGAVGGLMLALDQLLPATTRRHQIVDRELTRC